MSVAFDNATIDYNHVYYVGCVRHEGITIAHEANLRAVGFVPSKSKMNTALLG